MFSSLAKVDVPYMLFIKAMNLVNIKLLVYLGNPFIRIGQHKKTYRDNWIILFQAVQDIRNLKNPEEIEAASKKLLASQPLEPGRQVEKHVRTDGTEEEYEEKKLRLQEYIEKVDPDEVMRGSEFRRRSYSS